MAKVGFAGFAEENRDIPNEKNPSHSFEGNDETGLDKPSTQGSGPNEETSDSPMSGPSCDE